MDFSDFVIELPKLKKYLLINKQINKYIFLDMLMSDWFYIFVKNQLPMEHLKVQPKGRIWLEIDGKNFLGYGRVELLEKIEVLGSLRKAAIAMGMSYRKAYYAIHSINQLAHAPLVTLTKGGKGGGMALITSTGKEYIIQFRKFEKDFDFFLSEQTKI
jgi:molybdate transport system regulatory protein